MEHLPDLLARRAALTPHRTALHDLITGRAVTYAALNANAAALAGGLVQHGVAFGDRVAVLCRNRIEFFEVLFACAKAGAILTPLNWRSPATELAPIVAQTGPRLIFHGAEDRATALSLANAQLPAIDFDAPTAMASLMAAPAAPLRTQWRTSDTWYLLFTSGTTGAPKGVIQTYGMALANYVNLRQAIDLRDGDRTLNFLPLFHTAGINLHTLPTLLAGGLVHVLPGFDAGRMIKLLAGGALDTFFGVPAVYQQISEHPGFAEVDLSRVRHWGCGGAPLPDILVHRFAARGARVCNGFGMTETGPTVFLQSPDIAARKIGSVGSAQILTDVRIVTADGRDAETDEIGEVWMRGPNVTPGYWNNPQAIAAAFADGGWLRSGDLARRDGDGHVFIVGRSKEMYISGGENVYPAEVENVLALAPGVREAAVVGRSDARWGEVGWAYVMLHDGHDLDPEALTRFCRERLAGYKTPKRFIAVADFPRTAAGKVQKHLLPDPDAAS